METIKVNMTPCEDIKTIHASQNDNEGREWGFELHNNGEKIDSSSISDQLVFKAYEGGTEEILPTNGSTPTTSPFKGDIKYPQGLLTDQEFTYRESPTESDGLAFVESIKGDTLNWNQIYNVNSDRTTFGVNIKVVNGAVSITGTSTSTGSGPAFAWTDFKGVQGHKYIITKDFALPSGDYIFDQYNLNSSTDITTVVFTLNNSGEYIIPQLRVTQTGVTYNISGHLCVYDLTKMFGAGNEPTSVEEFTSLFNLPYYDYNQASLLSFNGNGIKTVGKNLIEGISQGAVGTHGETNTNANRLRVDGFVRVLQGEQYTFSASKSASTNLQIYTRFFADNDGSEQVSYLDWLTLPRTINIPNGINYATFTIRYQTSTAITPSDIYDVQLEIGASATDYEPYTSSTLSLPISTYFPSGMKSAGDAYDELTPTKAITRIGSVDLGSLEWTYRTTGSIYAPYFYASFTGIKPNGNPNVRKANILCSKYSTVYRGQDVFIDKTICADGSSTELTQLQIKDSSYTDATAFKTAMNGVMLYYELATPTETSFTTASLVTENAEIPLSAENDVLIGKCTEELSTQPGFIDAKIKLTDGDGTCYSNKIQLHVERKPS